MKTLKPVSQAIILSFATSAAYALDPMPIPVGEALFVPTLGLSVVNDDNIRASQDATSATIMSIAPKFLLGADTRNSAYQLEYGINHRRYNRSELSDLTDHTLAGRAAFDIDARNRLRLQAVHDRRESIDNLLNQNNTLDRIATNTLGGQYLFGATNAKYNIEVGVNHSQLRSLDSNTNQDLERNTNAFSVAVLNRISPRTQLELEGRIAQTDYQDNTAKIKDNRQQALLAGARWEATALTTGRAKLGIQNRSFNNDSRSDVSRSAWEVAVDWEPLTYTKFTFLTANTIEEGNLGFSFVDTIRTTLAWQHQWRYNLSSSVNFGRIQEGFKDSATESNRTDITNLAGVTLTYNLRRWTDIQLGYTYSDRDSDAAFRDYSRNQWRLGINMSL